ncbi:hypothetical protein VNO78_03905 [Psophocarpus tetragonolobus]|uniref:Dof-type domain-containing protein n=1 Tax=Psophocarpus tetragonolobus TaxID=3891 RepID=A0AAN9T1U3_PSOTE
MEPEGKECSQEMAEESEGIKLFGAMIRVKSGEGNEGEKEKRGEKIIACPRCKSMETKFCYFNNYNVNQPRHFCKSCQRYWTAGGALRKVAVGAGRRKVKSACHGHGAEAHETSQVDNKFEIEHRLRLDVSMPHSDFRQLFLPKRPRIPSASGHPPLLSLYFNSLINPITYICSSSCL